MCTVSMIGDFYRDKLGQPGSIGQRIINPLINPPVDRLEFDLLRKEVSEMKELLKRAIKYDEEHDEPHCELEEKVALLRKVAEAVGVDLTDIFKPNPSQP